MSLKFKIVAGLLGLVMVFGAIGVATNDAQAQTVDDLKALIAQLQSQLAALQGGGSGSSGACSFSRSLTVGSSGADVTCLQNYLISAGFSIPAGATGYFGSQTQAAVAAWQAANGVSPAVGFFGPISRARYADVAGSSSGSGSSGSGSGNCPAGFVEVPLQPAGFRCEQETTGGSTGITTPGVEGTLTVSSSNAGLISTLYEGDTMAPILGMKIEAKNSDIAVQRVKLDLGTNTEIYNKIYRRFHVTDGSNVLTSFDLNSSNVVKEGSTYYVTITGFNLLVPVGNSRTLVIKADTHGTFDSSDVTNINADSARGRVRLANDGVRGVDGAGINQYSPSTGSDVSRTVTLSKALSDSATLKVSLNANSAKKAEVVASDGSNDDELDKMTLFSFDVKAEKDDITITDLPVGVVKGGAGAATAQTAYLYDGNTEIDSASVTSSVATFSDIDFVIPKDSTKTLTVKIDVRNADATPATFHGTVSTSGANAVVAENSKGDNASMSGTVTGFTQSVRNVGLEISLSSRSVTTSGVPQGSSGDSLSTSTITATFRVSVTARGGDVLIGGPASTTAPFFSSGSDVTPSFKVYRNGAHDATLSSAATSTAYTLPSQCVSEGTNTCRLSEGTTISFDITAQLQGRTSAGTAFTSGLYAMQFSRANWVAAGETSVANATFMDGESDWRTSDVTFP